MIRNEEKRNGKIVYVTRYNPRDDDFDGYICYDCLGKMIEEKDSLSIDDFAYNNNGYEYDTRYSMKI